MKISVIVPCFNAASWIGVTLRSLLNQTLRPAEIIVANDGSDDDSAAIAESFGSPVKVLNLENGGAALARAKGAALATGDALMFMDADDLIAPETLAALAACLREHPDAIALSPWKRYERVDGTVWLPAPASCPVRHAGQDDLQGWLSGWYHPPCAVLWSRQAFERSGGWDGDVTVHDDGDVMMRGLVRGNRLILSETGMAFYRRLPDGTGSLSGRASTREGVASRFRVIDRIASMLGEQGRTAFYADDLRIAYRSILDTCPEAFLDLRGRVQDAVANLPARQRAQAGEGGLAVCRAAPEAPKKNDWRPPRTGTSPAVSVVIPTFNRAASVRRAIDSVLAQDHTDLELIVVDDASTDDTAQSVRRIADDRVRLLEQPVNGGVAAARNRGIGAARAPLIAFLDSDDIWLPGKLSLQVAMMEAMPAQVGIVYSGIENQTPGGAERWTPSWRGDVFRRLLMVNGIHGGASTAMIRREVFDMVGTFDTTFPAIEDYEMWTRIARFWQVEFFAEPFAAYFDTASDDTAGQRRSRNLRANNDARAMFHRRYLDDMRSAGIEHEFLLESARRRATEGTYGRLCAARTILKAIRHRPQAKKLYGWLALILVPPGPRDRIVALLRKAQRRARPDVADGAAR